MLSRKIVHFPMRANFTAARGNLDPTATLSFPPTPTIIRYFLTCRAISVNVIAKLFPLQIFSLISILYFKRERFVRII